MELGESNSDLLGFGDSAGKLISNLNKNFFRLC